MDDILSSNNGEEAVDSSNQAKASNDSSAKSRSSPKRRPKTRSKVWEKVAWFTRKTKSGRENKAESPEEARKDHKSLSLGVFRSEDEEGSQNSAALNVSAGNNLNSPSLCKAKSKSGIRKTKSFNYLKRKKLKHYVNEANSTLYEETKENSDPSTCQTATGNFHDFASVGRRSSSITTSSNNLVSEMAKEMNCKQEEQPKNSIKCSLSLPLSLLSLDEIPANLCGQRCQGFLCTCKPKTKSFSGPNYNSWPRKKRLLVSSQGYDAFSPPQKQKKICCLRKTATFSGFDSSKLSIELKNTGNAELRGVKSTPLLSGQNQIKNQNGLTIGVIHFFKSSRNKCSNYNTVVAKEMVISGPILANDVNQFDLYCGSSTEHRNSANTDTDVEGVDASNGINLHSDLEGKMTDSPNELLSTSNEQHGSKTSEDENISEELGACANVGSFVSMKDCFMVEDSVNEVYSMALKNTSSHQEDINKANISQQDIQEMSECSSAMMNDKNISLEAETRTSNVKLIDLDLALLNSSQQLCAIEKRAAYSKLEMIKEVPDSLAKVNEEDVESPVKYSKHDIVEKDGDQKDACSQSKATETGIYCIKIEDQVTDFSKEGKIDFHSQTKLQESSTFSENLVEKLKASAYTKEKTLFQCANNSNTSIPLCTMTSDSTDEEEHEVLVGKTTMLDDSVLLRNVITVQEERPRSCMYNGEEISQKVKNAANSYVSVITPVNTPEENQRTENPSKNIMKSNSHLSNRKLLQTAKPKVDGQHFKHQTETILDWFSEFNDEQKNILIKKLLEQCELPQMHLLSVAMEPVLHKTCPPNCQDMLAWLPHPVTNAVMSYLDPESLCRCSQVNRFWNSLASNPLIWKGLCKSSEWQLSRKTEENQLMTYTLPCGTVQWKKMFAERYLLRKNWLNGRCKVRTFEGHTQGISCVQFDDTRIVSGSTDKTIKVWDLSRDDSHAVLTLAGHSGTVRCLNLNGNRLVSGSVDRSIKVWDLSFESYWSGASCKVTMVGHMHTVRCLQVDDEKVVSGSYDKTLKVWDLKTGQCKLTLRGHNAAVLCVQFDDNKIVSGSYDNTIKVWSLHEGECLMTLAGHHDAVTCLNLTQDGRKVISGSLDHNLKFWDLATGKCIGTLDWIRSEGHTGVIRCLQSDSWRIVSAGDDKTLKMWSLETGQRLLTLRCHTDGVTCLQFNDYRIVSGSYDKTVKVWNFSPEHEFLNPS